MTFRDVRRSPASATPGVVVVQSLAFGTLVALALMQPRIAQSQDPTDTPLPRRSYFGARLAAVPDSLLGRGTPRGALITGFTPNSPAERAGLRVGDVVVGIGGRHIVEAADAPPMLRALRVGSAQPITVNRGGRAVHLVYTPEEWPRERAPDFDIWYASVATNSGRRRIIVTHPRDHARHPAVLLVGGIGCFSVDSPAGIDAYRDLMYHLTRHGYATVRVEKSGVGDSQGAPCASVDFETELAGYAAALRALKRYSFVDSARIFVFGHSIGGIEGPLLIARDSSGPPVRGIAVLSTVGISWYEYELANSRRQRRLSGESPDSIEQSMQRKARCAFRLLMARESSAAIVASEPECKPYFVYPASDAYMQQVAAINLGTTWSAVRAPVLVMYAGSDFITSRDEHLQLVDAINAMHPGNAAFADVPGMDHHLTAEPSQQAAFADSTPPANRAYFGATLEPIVDAWLDRVAAAPILADRVAPEQRAPVTGVDALQQMRDAYAGRWYTSLTFTQKTSTRGADGAEKVTTWYESVRYSETSGTQLRIDIGDPSEGNGVLYSADSLWVMRAGKLAVARKGGNALLPLIEGVYVQPVARTTAELAPTGVDLARPVVNGRWNEQPVWIVGATSAADTASPQFWVDTESKIVVRAILVPAPGAPKMDIRLEGIVPLANGWLATKCTFFVGGVVSQVEEYGDWKANVPLPAALFDIASWATAPHWAAKGRAP